METVTAYKASDGSLWQTKELAEEQEVSLRWRERIQEFAHSDFSPYRAGVQHGMIFKIVVGWERFKIHQLPICSVK